MAEPELVEAAPAKLNLDLLVTGRRADGYHELDSLIVFLAIGDRLTLAPAATLTLTLASSGPFAAALPPAKDNLVLRAARLLAPLAGGRGASLALKKHLPPASGIGGGSSDAAAALRGLNRLWALGLKAGALREIGLGLGADLPVCLLGRPARVRGIGERLDPVAGLPVLPLLLVNPGCPVPTGAVFAGLAAEGAIRPLRSQGLPLRPSLPQLAAWLEGSRNDLEGPARIIAPVVDDVLALLRAQPDCRLARMSGSGATCFGLFPSEVAAARAAGVIQAARPGWWVVATRTAADA